VKGLGNGLPKKPVDQEMFGFLIVLGYFLLIRRLLAKTWFKRFYQTLGPIRFHVMTFLFAVHGINLPSRCCCGGFST